MQKKKIVVLVDAIDILQVIEVKLSNNGFDVTCCRNAIDAIGEVWNQDPDLIITDLDIPGKTGSEFIGEVRAEDKDVPIIALASSFLNEAQLAELGVNKQIKKPFSPRNVFEAVQKLLAA